MSGLDYLILTLLAIFMAGSFVLLVYLSGDKLFRNLKQFLAKLWLDLRR